MNMQPNDLDAGVKTELVFLTGWGEHSEAEIAAQIVEPVAGLNSRPAGDDALVASAVGARPGERATVPIAVGVDGALAG